MSAFRSQEKLAGDVTPIIVNVMNFAKARGGRADAALLRRCAHAVPRVRPRPARPAVGRDLSADLRHQRGARLRRAALAALRALAGAAGGAASASPATTETGEPMPRGAARQAPGGRKLQPGLRDGRVRRLGAGRPRPASPRRGRGRSTSTPSRAGAAARIGMPAEIVMRHRTPHFQHIFSGDGYSGGLLQLSVVGGARRRRLPRLRGGRRHLRSRDGRKRLRDFIYAAGNRATRRRPIAPSAAAIPTLRRCSTSAAWSASRRAPMPETARRQAALVLEDRRICRKRRTRRAVERSISV